MPAPRRSDPGLAHSTSACLIHAWDLDTNDGATGVPGSTGR
jgi:hypothetical protein